MIAYMNARAVTSVGVSVGLSRRRCKGTARLLLLLWWLLRSPLVVAHHRRLPAVVLLASPVHERVGRRNGLGGGHRWLQGCKGRPSFLFLLDCIGASAVSGWPGLRGMGPCVGVAGLGQVSRKALHVVGDLDDDGGTGKKQRHEKTERVWPSARIKQGAC